MENMNIDRVGDELANAYETGHREALEFLENIIKKFKNANNGELSKTIDEFCNTSDKENYIKLENLRTIILAHTDFYKYNQECDFKECKCSSDFLKGYKKAIEQVNELVNWAIDREFEHNKKKDKMERNGE